MKWFVSNVFLLFLGPSEVTKLLTYFAQACHELVPPEVCKSLISYLVGLVSSGTTIASHSG